MNTKTRERRKEKEWFGDKEEGKERKTETVREGGIDEAIVGYSQKQTETMGGIETETET